MSSRTIAYVYSTLISQLHETLNMEPIPDFIHRLTAIFFLIVPPYPLVQHIGNYTVDNLNFLYRNINIKGRNIVCCN